MEKNSDVSGLDTNTVLGTKIKEIEDTISDVNILVTDTTLGTKLKGTVDKISDAGGLVTSTALNTKIKKIRDDIAGFDEKLKHTEVEKSYMILTKGLMGDLIKKHNILNGAKYFSLNSL